MRAMRANYTRLPHRRDMKSTNKNYLKLGDAAAAAGYHVSTLLAAMREKFYERVPRNPRRNLTDRVRSNEASSGSPYESNERSNADALNAHGSARRLRANL